MPEHSVYRQVSGRVQCARCAAIVEPQQSEYSETGDILCNPCAARGDIAASERRAITRMLGLGYSNLLIGVLALMFNPFFATSVVAVVNGSVVVSSLAGPWYSRRVKRRRRIPSMLCAVLGAMLGLLLLLSFSLSVAPGR
ncbi:MAG: hypothetical protein AAGC55_08885 [Myxococcota bacterium]